MVAIKWHGNIAQKFDGFFYTSDIEFWRFNHAAHHRAFQYIQAVFFCISEQTPPGICEKEAPKRLFFRVRIRKAFQARSERAPRSLFARWRP